VASQKTAVLGRISSSQRDLVRIDIGNFPPKSSAILIVHFCQMLEVEDLSYCLRIPNSYVPRYLGYVHRYIETGNQFVGQNENNPTNEESKQTRMEMVKEASNIQVS